MIAKLNFGNNIPVNDYPYTNIGPIFRDAFQNKSCVQTKSTDKSAYTG
jgi:hypothetical protein